MPATSEERRIDIAPAMTISAWSLAREDQASDGRLNLHRSPFSFVHGSHLQGVEPTPREAADRLYPYPRGGRARAYGFVRHHPSMLINRLCM